MVNKDEHFKSFIEGAIDRNNNLVLHSAAVDIRVLALTSLLMEKGIITEKEVQDSYQKAFDAVIEHEDYRSEKMKGFEEYLKYFLRL